jgi:para-nitrobenzyl esterase
MKNIKLILICLIISSKLLGQNIIIQTANGKVEGSSNVDKSIHIFKGIPFATPPIGDLRWKAPKPPKNWEGVLKCNEFSASPIQNKPAPFMCWTEEFIAKPEPLSEDCLYLNVWTSVKKTKEKLPVFVWIYGGGLSSGSANCDIYDGEEMAKKGVVFVSINYRVGVLGFMAHPELSKESGHNSSGNYGFLDQMEALRWIQKNIAAFGGDPNNVTIAGQSAGSFSVNALVASPLTKGLFHKAIAQSGGLLSSRMSSNLAESEQQGVKFMQNAEINSIAELRNKTAEELQKLSSSFRFGTTLDGYVLPINLLQHFEKGLHNDVPLLTGWVTGDGALMGNAPISLEKYQSEAKTNFGDKSEMFLSIFPARNDEEAKAAKTKLAMFQFAGMPSHLWAGFNKKNKSYLYQFSHVPPDKPNFPNYGAFHTSEVPYALHTLKKWNRAWQQTDWDLENKISSYWVNFAKTGNPNGKNLPEWKVYDKSTGYIMELGDKVILKEASFKKELDFLEMTKK